MLRDYDSIVVYLMRIYKWEYDYTVNLVRTLPQRKLNILLAETYKQEASAFYQQAELFAMVCAVTVNLQSKEKYTVQDFIGAHPFSHKPKKDLIIAAVRTQLKLKIPN